MESYAYIHTNIPKHNIIEVPRLMRQEDERGSRGHFLGGPYKVEVHDMDSDFFRKFIRSNLSFLVCLCLNKYLLNYFLQCVSTKVDIAQ